MGADARHLHMMGEHTHTHPSRDRKRGEGGGGDGRRRWSGADAAAPQRRHSLDI